MDRIFQSDLNKKPIKPESNVSKAEPSIYSILFPSMKYNEKFSITHIDFDFF